jgi:hypothetical protein
VSMVDPVLTLLLASSVTVHVGTMDPHVLQMSMNVLPVLALMVAPVKMASMSSSANVNLDLKEGAVNRRVTFVRQILVNMGENAKHILTPTPVSVLKDFQERTVKPTLMIANWHHARMEGHVLT